MSTFLIESLSVKRLWGEKNFRLRFDPKVNILIGPNASGKTTLLKLLHSVFSGDFVALQDIEFQQVSITLKAFDDGSRYDIRIEPTDEGFNCFVNGERHEINLDEFSVSQKVSAAVWWELRSRYIERPPHGRSSQEVSETLRNLVPTVWLPVSRRLPIPNDDYSITSQVERSTRIDSVDERLRELMASLSRYRLRLDAQLSERYKEFERTSLQIMLYNEEYDTLGAASIGPPPNEEEKEILIQAFQEAGLLDTNMRKRIDQHFSSAEEAIRRLVKRFDEEQLFSPHDLLIIPLIPRTRDMVEAARRLEEQREVIFASLRKYEHIVSTFYEGKSVRVLDNGDLEIQSFPIPYGSRRSLSPERLSSGEKQLLILLTQALLKQDQPVVYLADEPELSLHVSWQEKLLESLLALGGQTQVILATHSPDIVGSYHDNVIDLARRG